MARTDNLINFLTDVANAIREKTGETDIIYARDFDTKISSISGSSEPEITTRLPARYQEVEYIESIDYNNYIDTGVVFPNVKKVRYEFKVKMPDNIRNQAYWGCFMNGGYNGGTLYENRYYVAGDNTLNLALEVNGTYEGYAYTDTNTKSGAFYANNGEINETLTYTTGGGLPDSDRAPFCIFCQGTPSGSGTYYNNGSKLRVYYFRIYLDDVIVRDFVPCYKKEYNTIGLYDLVNEIFYANQGTGVLEKGEDVNVEIEPAKTLNMFVQETEPETKKGVWVKTSANIKPTVSTISQNDITKTAGGWAPVGAYANLPHSNGYALATGYKSIMYFGGGYGSQAYNLYSYDITTNTYTKLPDIPYSFGWGGLCAYEDELYMFGGMGGPTTAYKYNIAEQTYTRLADIPVGFVSAVAVVCDNEIFLITGRPSETSSTRYNTIYKYNPTDNTYTLCSATIHNGDCKSAVCFDNYIYIFGSDQDYKACYRYEPATDTAVRMSDIPFDCTDTYTCATQDAIYLVGSSRSSRALWKYEPALDRYERLPDAPLEIWGPGSGALINDRYLFAIGDISQHVRVLVYEIPQTEYQSTLFDGVMIDCSTMSRTTELVDNLDFYFTRIMHYISGQKQNDVEIYYGNGTNWIKL